MARYPLPCPYCKAGPFNKQALEQHLETCPERMKELGWDKHGWCPDTRAPPPTTTSSSTTKENFESQLQPFLPDEIQANKDYSGLAATAYSLGLNDIGQTLNLMANDENQHHENLLQMVESLHHLREGGELEKHKFTVHDKEYWWTKDELINELGIEPDEVEQVWESGQKK